MKRARMLLRVSSNQQLESDGDLSIQRQLVKDYASSHSDWILDSKEYFEGSNSGYQHSVADRDVLQEALKDAGNHEFDILVVYKDDRVGRRMWEIGAYVMALKGFGVDIYTVKDGCISPDADDIMGQMMLALRYGNAQKSSADTGMRVKDTAQKLVQKGKFMGGNAPYGYHLELSGEISKHGRALHHLVITPEQAKVVQYIYHLSLHKELGSAKIAKQLNEDMHYLSLAPKDVWKSATITSILTNPIYAGFTAYKRRERRNGRYHRLKQDGWIIADTPNETIQIIEPDIWNQVQHKRKCRSDQYLKTPEHKNTIIIRRNEGMLSLIDVAYCGYCGRKLTNGTRYSYWKLKNTGEKKACKILLYRCQAAQSGIPHNKSSQFRADKTEKIVLAYIGGYINKLLTDQDIKSEMESFHLQEQKTIESQIRNLHLELDKVTNGIEILQSHIADAMQEAYPLSVEEIADAIHKQQDKEKELKKHINQNIHYLEKISASYHNGQSQTEAKLPTWKQVFEKADLQTKRVLVNKLVERIDITKEQITIHFRTESIEHPDHQE